jgi:fructose-1,6-bisphosphatase/inositol monophosphatase family enzyme
MTHKYIEDMYRRGGDAEARRAIRAEIVRENTPENEEPTYEPTDAEIDALEAEYYASRRARRYGSPAAQMEYITEHGLDGWQSHVAQIKREIPKP